MNEHTNFIAYCIEEYKTAEHLNGKAVITLFSKYNVFEYITSCYDVLHTTGGAYIAGDIKRFIENQQ
jgi:hypothetical protein